MPTTTDNISPAHQSMNFTRKNFKLLLITSRTYFLGAWLATLFSQAQFAHLINVILLDSEQ